MEESKFDGRSKYNKVCELLRPIVGQEVGINTLWRMIMIEVGATDKTIRDTFKLMLSLGLIQEIEHLVYRVVRCK